MGFNFIVKRFVVILFIFTPLIYSFGEDPVPDEEISLEKPTLAILPFIGRDVPVFIPRVLDKLIEAKIDKIDTYTLSPQENIKQFLSQKGIALSDEPKLDLLKKYSDSIDVDQVMFGAVSKDGGEYNLGIKVFDVKSKEVVLNDSETAAGIKAFDTAADNLARKIVQKLFPPKVVAKAEEVLDKEADTKKEAKAKENLSELTKIAEKDPERALEMLEEPARKAIEDSVKNRVKEEVKKEVVYEEIQNLFEEEKARKARERKRKWQFWTTFSLVTLDQVGNIFGSLAEYERTSSLVYWDKYMNNSFEDDPYRIYRDAVLTYGGFTTQKYVFSGLGNIATGIGVNYLLDDTFTFTKAGRVLFSVFYGLNTLGDGISTLATQLQFISTHKYLVYLNATEDFSVKYNSYRDSLLWPEIARYTSYGLWGLGYAGMIVSALLPGERSPMILSKTSRRLLSWGSGLTGMAAILSGLALNYNGRAEESWITDNSPTGTIGESLTDQYSLTADILTYTSYGFLLAGGIMSVVGLLLPEAAGSVDTKTKDNTVSFNIVPSSSGTSLVVTMGLE